jgi:spermidine/putrescine-binding protein
MNVGEFLAFLFALCLLGVFMTMIVAVVETAKRRREERVVVQLGSEIGESFQDEVIAAAEEALGIVEAVEVSDEDESDVAADDYCKYCGHKLPTDPEELKEGCPMCGGPIA